MTAVQSTKKKVELWPYVPYTPVVNLYAHVYDKKSPSNHVRKVPDTATVTETILDDRYINMFNDENPDACSIM
ncbi:hypothetical protein V6N13_118441 [Hibiscus sabdariffa]